MLSLFPPPTGKHCKTQGSPSSYPRTPISSSWLTEVPRPRGPGAGCFLWFSLRQQPKVESGLMDCFFCVLFIGCPLVAAGTGAVHEDGQVPRN